MAYLKSNQVLSVYPTAYRNAIFDNQADNNTEFNVTNIADRIGRRNYVIYYDTSVSDDAVALIVSIGGYVFQISKLGVNAIKSAFGINSVENIYLYIRTATDTTFKEKQLVEADGTSLTVSSLDTSNSSTSVFQGLGYNATIPSDKEYLKVFTRTGTAGSYSWSIPSTSYVILDSTQIGNGSDEPAQNTLRQKITTGTLEVEGNSTFTGNITQSGTSKFNGVRIDAQTTGIKLSGGTTSKALDVQADTTIKDAVTVNKALTVGAESTYTGSVEIKGKSVLSIVGDKATLESGETAQTVKFNGTSTFQGGDYSSSTTTISGITANKIKVGGNEFDVLTRDAKQQITGDKEFTTGLLNAPTIKGNLGVCSTVAANTPKVVSLTNFKLVDGAHVFVYFDNSNTVSKPYLNINSTGSKPILKQSATSNSEDSLPFVGNLPSSSWPEKTIVEFVYRSSSGIISGSPQGAWIMVGYNDTSNKVRAVKETSNTIYLVGSKSNDTNDSDSLYIDTSISVKGGNLYIPSGGNIIINEYIESDTIKYKTKLFGNGTIDTQAVTVGYTAGTASAAHKGSKLTTSLETQSITLPSNLTASGTASSADMLGTSKRSVADSYGNTIYSTYVASLTSTKNSNNDTLTVTAYDKTPTTAVSRGSFSLKLSSGLKKDGSTNIAGDLSESSSTYTFTLGASGATAGIYGNLNNSSQPENKEPGYGGTFNVPYIRVNAKGIITDIGTKTVKIPASDNSDTVTTLGSGNSTSGQGYIRWWKDGTEQTSVLAYNLGTNGNPSFASVTATNSFNISSDERLKENIESYKCEKSILDLDVKEFDYKNTGEHHIGCIAQDLQKICPEIVHEGDDGYLTIEENKIVYLLLQEVKELKKKIEELGGK